MLCFNTRCISCDFANLFLPLFRIHSMNVFSYSSNFEIRKKNNRINSNEWILRKIFLKFAQDSILNFFSRQCENFLCLVDSLSKSVFFRAVFWCSSLKGAIQVCLCLQNTDASLIATVSWPAFAVHEGSLVNRTIDKVCTRDTQRKQARLFSVKAERNPPSRNTVTWQPYSHHVIKSCHGRGAGVPMTMTTYMAP